MIIINQEAYNMLAVFFECMQNATIAARVYAVRYPNVRRRGRASFLTIAERLRTTGSVHLRPRNR